jgi:uncharacterized protein with HEPN domain
MTEQALQILTRAARDKAQRAITALLVSCATVTAFDPARDYTLTELEPYDAISSRFIRAVEMALRFMRTLERLEFAEQSDSVRDLLHRMEKLGMVSETGLWLMMRDMRNRIVHDYLPGEIKVMYDNIIGVYSAELEAFSQRIATRII